MAPLKSLNIQEDKVDRKESTGFDGLEKEEKKEKEKSNESKRTKERVSDSNETLGASLEERLGLVDKLADIDDKPKSKTKRRSMRALDLDKEVVTNRNTEKFGDTIHSDVNVGFEKTKNMLLDLKDDIKDSIKPKKDKSEKENKERKINVRVDMYSNKLVSLLDEMESVLIKKIPDYNTRKLTYILGVLEKTKDANVIRTSSAKLNDMANSMIEKKDLLFLKRLENKLSFCTSRLCILDSFSSYSRFKVLYFDGFSDKREIGLILEKFLYNNTLKDNLDKVRDLIKILTALENKKTFPVSKSVEFRVLKLIVSAIVTGNVVPASIMSRLLLNQLLIEDKR